MLYPPRTVLKLIIEDDEGRKTVVPFVREEITIGRQEGNTIRLTERNVSRRHARLVRSNGHVLVEDLASYNGLRVNGEKVSGQAKVQAGDLIQIGDYDLAIQDESATQPSINGNDVAPPPASELMEAEIETTRPRATFDQAPTELENKVLPTDETPRPGPAPVPPSGGAIADTQPLERLHQATAIIRVDHMAGMPSGAVENIDAAQAPRLVVLNTEFAGREFACIRTELRIGRTDDNDIAIDHRSMSRTHAKLVRTPKGEWRVLDLQSANGLKVNGEIYGQSMLKAGDVLELGHLKLKFVGPGDTFRATPTRDVPARKSGGKGGLFAAVGAVALLAAAGGAYLVFGGDDAPSTPVATAAPAAPATAEESTTVEMPPPETKDPAEVAALVKQARAAIAAREFDKALELLDVAAEGQTTAEVQDLLDQTNLELAAKKNLALAQRALEDGDLEEAATVLAQAQGTLSFAREYEKLKARVDTAVARAEAKRPKPAAATVTASAQKPAAPPSPAEVSAQHLEDGIQLLKKKQYASARDSLQKCLKTDPGQARCHMYLGSAYAKLRELETAATHYRSFIAMAPDDPLAPKVKELLEQYEKQK